MTVLRSFKVALLAATLVLLTMPLQAAKSRGEAPWPSWLYWLFGTPKPPGTGVERSNVTFTRNDRGDIVAVSETYVVKWTSDGNGSPDSLLFSASGTGQPVQVRNSGSPTFPASVTVTWQSAAPGAAVVTQGCAKVKRRSQYSAQACSATRSYVTPDVPPPPPVVDTIAGLRIGFSPTPKWTALAPSTPHSWVCPVYTVLDGTHGVRASDLPGCQPVLDSLSNKIVNPAYQRVVDRQCVDWRFDPAMGRVTLGGPNGCDRLLAGTLGARRLGEKGRVGL